MSNIKDILDDTKNFVSIPLVGNKYCKKRPTNNDKNIKIVKEVDNIYDSNALKVVSKRDNIEHDLGYIIKDKIDFVNLNLDKLKFFTILKKNNQKMNSIYYYLIFKIII